MRYIDSGSRDPNEALGTWLSTELIGSAPPAALRVQTGFFGSDALGYFEDALSALGQNDGHTRFLIGSNDGQTPRAAMADLLAVAGQPRSGLRIGVVSFQSGFFHPKVFHIQRADGSSTAYIGSANLTASGTTSLHVEAGLIVDTKSKDPKSVLDSIADAVDGWFSSNQAGLYEVADDADLDPLVNANVLGVAQPRRSKRTVKPTGSQGDTISPAHSLTPLVAAPPVQTPLPSSASRGSGNSSGGGQQTPGASPQPKAPPKSAAADYWGKTLSSSDAGRKNRGTARGSIPLSQGDLRGTIDQSKYFREELFGQLTWEPSTTRTGKPTEITTVPMHVTIDGTYHHVLAFKVTDEQSRLQGEKNLPTSQLHVAPITSVLEKVDVTGMHLDITLDANGEYWLTIE